MAEDVSSERGYGKKKQRTHIQICALIIIGMVFIVKHQEKKEILLLPEIPKKKFILIPDFTSFGARHKKRNQLK